MLFSSRYTVSVDGKSPTDLSLTNSELVEDKVNFYWKKDMIGGSKARFKVSCKTINDGPSYIIYGEKGKSKDCESKILCILMSMSLYCIVR